MDIDLSEKKNIDKLNRLLMPYMFKKVDEARNNRTRLCHYTSAESGIHMLRNKEVWLRNARVMNDFSEVQHGHKCLAEAWHDHAVGGRLRALLNEIEKDLDKTFESKFDSFLNAQFNDSYLISLSEHHGGAEDSYGRLSMWRAYGGDTNVAFVFNNRVFFTPSDALQAYTTPVWYGAIEPFKAEFKKLVENLEIEKAFIEKLSREWLIDSLVDVFHFAVLSTKHPGFEEEREWRIIYSPTKRASEKIVSKIEIVGGLPQRVYKIPLKNYPDEGFTGAELPELIDRIIIGPTDFPWPIRDAFVEVLGNAGVAEPEKKIIVSDIPLRR